MKVCFKGSGWGEKALSFENPIEVFEVNSKANWLQTDAFLNKHTGKYIVFFLNYQLKSLFPDFELKQHEKQNWPLAIFLAFDKPSPLSLSNKAVSKGKPSLQPVESEASYLNKLNGIKQLIQQGEFYETNYCTEFFGDFRLNAEATFNQLWQNGVAPYSVFFEYKNQYILSASPELFLRKQGNKLSSSPIKGTQRRSSDADKDKELAEELKNSRKEVAENTMIVDLVRHDLSQVALMNSVELEEYCKVYTFPTVHQLISTVSCELKTNSFSEIIQHTFPMGSMTGAPKISAVTNMDSLEPSARTAYSGSVGLIHPNGDFVSNVLIRTLLYNQNIGNVSASVGGAITTLSDPKAEYQECLLKLDLLQKSLVTC